MVGSSVQAGRIRGLAVAVFVALGVLVSTAWSDPDSGVLVRHKDKVIATLSDGGDVDPYRVYLPAGTRPVVKVKRGSKKSGSTVLPQLRITGPGDIDLSVANDGTDKNIKFGDYTVPEGASGVWTFDVSAFGDEGGEYLAQFVLKWPKPGTIKVKDFAVSDAMPAVLPFEASAGSSVTVVAKNKSDVPLSAIYLVDPDGNEVVGSRAAFVEKKGKHSLKKFLIPAGCGTFGVASEAGAATTLKKLTVKVKFPTVTDKKVLKKGRLLDPELSLTGVDDGDVRQEDVATKVRVNGANFLHDVELPAKSPFDAKTTAVVSGEGVTVSAVRQIDATTLELDVDVTSDAAFGLRDLTIIPPVLLGEPKTLPAVIRVLAPIPTITGTSTPIAKQNDPNAQIVVQGTGFRAGCTLAVEGRGVLLNSFSLDSPTQITLDLNVANGAGLGPRDVTYTQPVAGGADAVTADDLFTVNYPDPEITSATPSIVKQRDSDLVVTLNGEGFRVGATPAISGTGVTIKSFGWSSDQTFGIVLDVAADATYGPRDVTITQPQDGGGASGVGMGVITVNAPDPTLDAIAPSAITQDDTDVQITLTGTHFRDGGSVTSPGNGLTIGSFTRVSDTQATVLVSAADDADLGPQDLTYMQPAAGGGASDTFADALQVDAPLPTVSDISIDTVKQLDTGVEITLTGTEFRDGGTVAVAGAGITHLGTTVDSRTSARFTIDVDEFAAVGLRDVTFMQPTIGGGRSATLTDALRINHPDPTFTAVTPNQIRRTKTGTLRLTGTNFRDGCVVTTNAPQVTMGATTVVSTTEVDVVYTVGGTASLTTRDLTYTQPAAGGSATATLTNAYEVFSAPPTLTSMTPDELRPGDAFVPCVIIGTLFVPGTTVSVEGSSVTVEDLEVTSATRLDLIISVPSTATFGPKDVSIELPVGPPEVFDDAFTVLAADPTITSVDVTSLAQGADDAPIEIRGTNFLPGSTLSASGTGVSFASINVVDTTTITAEVDVTSGAGTGLRDLTVTLPASAGGRSGTKTDAFAIVGTGPTVSSISPADIARTGTGGPTRTVTALVTGTKFMSGASVTVSRSGGSGVSVATNGVRVLSDTSLEVQLAVTGTATTGSWDVQVANPGTGGNSGTTGNGVLDIVTRTTLTVNQVMPPLGSTYGGDRVVVYGGGFVDGCVVDFGTERGYLVQVIDANTLLCTVPQPTSASQTDATSVTVKVTTPTATNASRMNGYAYRKDTTTLFVDASVPAVGATGIPATLAVSAVKMSAPCPTLPAYSGSSATFPENTFFWTENGGSGVASGALTSGLHSRWIIYTRDTTSPLTVGGTGVYRMYVPGTVQSLSGIDFTEINRPSSGSDAGYDTYDYTVSSGTSDVTAPTVSSTTPGSGATGVATTNPITIVMSEAVDPRSILGANITLKQGTTDVGFHLDVSDDLTTITLSPHTELAHSTSYTVTITTGVMDMHTNALASAVARSFTTGGSTDSMAPTIDAAMVERLSAEIDGSGTYVAGVDSTGSSINPVAAGPGASTAFDLFVPRSGFELCVEFSDDGGSGIDPTSFSAKCSVAVGNSSANAELASNFTVTPLKATWRIPSTSLVATGENVTFTFTIDDVAGNTSSSSTITVDVGSRTANSQAAAGGDLDPFNARQTWVLRTDLDDYTSTFFTETLGGLTYPRMTTTNVGNDVADFDEGLVMVGLATDSMTAAAAATTNGPSRGTNQIMRRLVAERIRELTRERFGIDADGTRDGDSPSIEFLLQGELGSLATQPSYASSSVTNSTSGFSELSICGTKGAESNGEVTARVESASPFDVRNTSQEALLNTDGTYGVFMTSMMKVRLGDGRFRAGGSSAWRGMLRVFGKNVLEDLNGTWGGTPVGEHASDDDVLAATFDRSTSANATHNDRYDSIHTAIETVALWISCNVALEVANSTGLIPDGGPKTGLFGHAHRNNTFTDASTSALNVTNRIYWKGVNNLMAPDGTLFEKFRTGSDHRRFNPLAMAWLRQRLLYDEGQ